MIIESIKNYLDKRKQLFYDPKSGKFTVLQIDRELLLKNRLKAALFIIFALIGTLTINLVITVLYLNNIISFNTYLSVQHFYFFVILVLGIFFFPYHPMNYGFNLNKLKYNLKIGLLFGGFGFLLSVIIRYFLVKNGKTDFSFHLNFDYSYLTYPIVVITQEALIKGYFQSFLITVFDNLKGSKWYAIIIVSIIFAQMHILFGPCVTIIGFLFSVFTGWFYEKTRSLVGVVIIHYLSGVGLLYFIVLPN